MTPVGMGFHKCYLLVFLDVVQSCNVGVAASSCFAQQMAMLPKLRCNAKMAVTFQSHLPLVCKPPIDKQIATQLINRSVIIYGLHMAI